MELISQHSKKIMEGCKERAREHGLSFADETLEYIVTNRDLLELTPKLMIPTLYDYWVHDIEVLKEKGRYELYPSNPYETVINTRPPISFYNDNNPDWMNVMIFYHVLAHIDFFQNNLYFQHTWDYDFTARALSDKRLIAKLRSEHGRWVDYVIEFARGIDNLVGYYDELAQIDAPLKTQEGQKFDFYFDLFLQDKEYFKDSEKPKITEYIKEIDRYNDIKKKCNGNKEKARIEFFKTLPTEYKHFEGKDGVWYRLNIERKQQKLAGKTASPKLDLMQYIMENSPFLNKPGRNGNEWMKSVMSVVRNTSVFFQPQIRTKIMNEGWASYWHEKLFLKDDRIESHEVDFARTHAFVTSLPRVGMNPYALGMRIFQLIEEELGNKGKYSIKYRKLLDANERKEFDEKNNVGQEFIYRIRERYNDFGFINSFIDQDLVNNFKLFVAGKRLNQQKGVWEYYVKSRNVEDYREMVRNLLYHPVYISLNKKKMKDENLYLYHHFEGKPLVKEFIFNTMLGIEYLWGGEAKLETSEVEKVAPSAAKPTMIPIPGLTMPKETDEKQEIKWQRVLYTMKDRKLSRAVLTDSPVHKK